MPRSGFLGLYLIGATILVMLLLMPLKHHAADTRRAPESAPSRIRVKYEVDDNNVIEFYNDNGEVCTFIWYNQVRSGLSCSAGVILE